MLPLACSPGEVQTCVNCYEDAGVVRQDVALVPDAGVDNNPDVLVDAPDAAIIEQPAYGTRSVDVSAKTYWQSSELFLYEGQSVTLSATGEWTMFEGSFPFTSAEGNLDFDLDGCVYSSLIASIGIGFRASPLCVGLGTTLTATQDGILYFKSNDGILEDNAGSVNVTTTSEGRFAPTLERGDIAATDFDTIDAPEVEVSGEHVVLRLPRSLVASNKAITLLSLDQFDAVFESHAALAGAHAYAGEKIRFVTDEAIADIGAHMLSGNPIRYRESSRFGDVGGENILRMMDHDYSSWGFVHELGHDFVQINRGSFSVGYGPNEAWANVFTLYTLQALGHPEATRFDYCEGVSEHEITGTYDSFIADEWIPLCFLMEFQDQFGWVFFENFLRQYNAEVYPPIPTDLGDLVRWQWLRDRFNELAGSDQSARFVRYKILLAGQ